MLKPSTLSLLNPSTPAFSVELKHASFLVQEKH